MHFSYPRNVTPRFTANLSHQGPTRIQQDYYRATRMHSADYAVAKCLSVCLFVRLSHAGILPKWLYTKGIQSFFTIG